MAAVNQNTASLTTSSEEFRQNLTNIDRNMREFNIANGVGRQELVTMMQQLWTAALATEKRCGRLELEQQWSTGVQAALPLELKELVRDTLERNTRHARSRVLRQPGLRRSARPPKLARKVSPATFESEEAAANPGFNEIFGNDNAVVQTHRLPIPSHHVRRRSRMTKSDRRIYNKRVRNFLGNLDINAYQSYLADGYEDEHLSEIIEVEIMLYAKFMLRGRFLYASIIYDKTHGLSSPTNISLVIPQIHLEGSALFEALVNGSVEVFKAEFCRQNWGPDDRICHRNGYQYSLLEVSVSLIFDSKALNHEVYHKITLVVESDGW